MQNVAKIIENKVQDIKNTEFYAILEREINDMFERVIRSVITENDKLKRQNNALKRVVKNTMEEKAFVKFN